MAAERQKVRPAYNQPNPGLYVAGQDSGGFFSCPCCKGVGWTQGFAWNSGSVAAKHMIASIQAE